MKRSCWYVKTDATGRDRLVKVFIYEKLSHLRAAASRYTRAWDKTASFGEALAVCHSHPTIDAVTGNHKPHIATIRLHRGTVNPLLISHEVMHAVACMYREDCTSLMDYVGEHMQGDNELLAEVYSEVFHGVWRAVELDREERS